MISIGTMAQMAGSGLILEFGVAGGSSITGLAKAVPDRLVYGFDSWEGLPEDWDDAAGNIVHPKGDYRCPIPSLYELPSNVRLVRGLFQDTLPRFLEGLVSSKQTAFVHIDCDLYSSTFYVLNQLKDYLNGAIVAFDELFGFPEYEAHEGRALRDFVAATGYQLNLIGNQHKNGAGFRFVKRGK